MDYYSANLHSISSSLVDRVYYPGPLSSHTGKQIALISKHDSSTGYSCVYTVWPGIGLHHKEGLYWVTIASSTWPKYEYTWNRPKPNLQSEIVPLF